MKRSLRVVDVCAALLALSCAHPGWSYDPNAPLLRPRKGGELVASYLEEDRQPRILRLGDTSDDRFDEFLSPLTNPIYFEDPRSVTEARFVFLHNSLAQGLGAPGEIQYFGMQLRAAITHRVSVISTKAGYFCIDNTGQPDDGWANTNVGLKLGLYADPDRQRLLSLGALYEIASGSGGTQQGLGNGEMTMFLTAGSQFGVGGSLLSAAGVRMPVDSAHGAQVFYWSNHLDHALLGTRLYAVAETNWYHYLKSGRQPEGDAGGLDLFNFGPNNVAGWDIVTAACGLRYKPRPAIETGVVYEMPISVRRDIMHHRVGVDWIWRY